MTLRLTLAAALLGAGLALAPHGTAAQDQEQVVPPAADITDQQLENFAAAALEVNRIGRDWAERIQGAEDQAAAQDMREQAQEEMIAAVREEGLTVEEYNAIYAAAENDEEINTTIQELIQAEQQADG